MAVETVTFEVDGARIVGALHAPDGEGPFPGVVVGGPMTSVKEQVTGTYAAALARRGVAALAIDHRHYGESGGAPRQFEHYPHKIADLQAAIDALARHGRIVPSQLAAVGVCLGCGYLAHAIAGRDDVKAFAAVAGYYRDVDDMRARDPDGFAATVREGQAARERYEATGEVLEIPAVALDRDAAMKLQSTYDYYADRAAHPNYVNRFAVMSREHFVQFDVQPAAPRLTAPFLMLHGPNALNPAWAEKFYANVDAPKARGEIVSKGQTDIYDDPAIVEKNADAIARFLTEAGLRPAL